ncbi:MAG: hydroxymethylbilane synthase [Planctomycetaceae bacterium]|nr:hydroxymethylbilane synthase [Planctomycetaceae bacterium]
MTTNNASRTLKIATRSSPLALWQAHYVAEQIGLTTPEVNVEIVHVSTLGDRDRSEPLAQFGGMGVFTREVQKVVLDQQADLAVHSLKDLPTESVAGLSLAGVPPRAPRFDALVLPEGATIHSLDQLPQGAQIGTGSPRRQAQLLHVRPDLMLAEIRGNVETRLKKLDAGEYDAIILAVAGLTRLETAARISLILEPPVMFPAVGQAALGIECRADDAETISILQRLTDPHTLAEVTAERACLATLRAGCHAPVGVMSRIDGDTLQLEGVVLSRDGRQRYLAEINGPQAAAQSLGRQLAEQLIAAGAAAVLESSD